MPSAGNTTTVPCELRPNICPGFFLLKPSASTRHVFPMYEVLRSRDSRRLEFYYLVQAALFYMIGHVIGVVAGCVCAGALGVFEHVSEIETYVLHKRERLEMVVFRFGRIAGNHIHSDATIGDFFSYTVYKRYVFFPRVSAAHVAQYTARAALERQVEITADVFVCRL